MKVLLYASGSSLIPFLIGISLVHNLNAGLIAAALWFASALVGAGVFWTVKRFFGPHPTLSAMLSGMIAIGLLAIAVASSQNNVHSNLVVFLMIVLLVAALITTIPAIIFGCGVGQVRRKSEAEQDLPSKGYRDDD